ncbi:hypothetical protein OGATHE_000726 [Ogataea polymorpha]|uniref:Uncharacterized protein n=1 Tax=Ogataea polymorpha TaxID=460523 RepID=A0A9P8PTN0_9ASCO|nr:hypothetical protein OGATHE_000726 [Ogataea polymorpha]
MFGPQCTSPFTNGISISDTLMLSEMLYLIETSDDTSNASPCARTPRLLKKFVNSLLIAEPSPQSSRRSSSRGWTVNSVGIRIGSWRPNLPVLMVATEETLLQPAISTSQLIASAV